MVRVTLPDGTPLELHDGATALDAAEKIGPRLAKATLAAKINDLPVDATTALRDGDRLALLTWDSPEGRDVYRHTTSHIMAQAVKRLFPEAKPAIGPALEDRFYYDFEVGRPFSPEDLEKIETAMAEIIKEDLPVTRFELPVEEAIKLFSDRNEPYKVEILRDLSDQSELVPGEKVSLYQQGEYVDLCRGPHLPSTGRVKAFKLLSSSGAYWRGDEKRQMLQRIYGTS
ncbi:MAG TPA: TGS domain-containing protein, partial [Candidatus Latescibacteria bacterium]|nr:TGS domain-containing protein [Candidatus Latescibacterota bacterium]